MYLSDTAWGCSGGYSYGFKAISKVTEAPKTEVFMILFQIANLCWNLLNVILPLYVKSIDFTQSLIKTSRYSSNTIKNKAGRLAIKREKRKLVVFMTHFFIYTIIFVLWLVGKSYKNWMQLFTAQWQCHLNQMKWLTMVTWSTDNSINWTRAADSIFK